MNRKSTLTKKVLILLVALLMVFGNVASPLSGVSKVYAAEKVTTWAELQAAVEVGGEIEITENLVAESTITVNKNVKITGAGKTIYRQGGNADFPVFTVNGGTLELGEGITLSGKSTQQNCDNPIVVSTTRETTTVYSWERQDITAFYGEMAEEYPKGEVWEENVGGNPNVKRRLKGKYIVIAEGDDVSYLNTDTSELNYSTDVFKSEIITDFDGTAVGYTALNEKYQDTAKYELHDFKDANKEFKLKASDGKNLGFEGTTAVNLAGKHVGTRDQDQERDWMVEVESDTGQTVIYSYVAGAWPRWDHFDDGYETISVHNKANESQANITIYMCYEYEIVTKHEVTECPEGCAVYTNEQFTSGTTDSPRGFFVQVNAGELKISGATLRDFVTDKTVTYAAPVVVNGGNFSMTGGSIEHNSVGYSADNSKSGDSAKNIGKEKEDGQYGEKGYIGEWENTETAGAIIFTGKSAGTISGGEIKDNRGDTGAILVQGKPDKQDETETGTIEGGSSLDISGGSIDNNVGIHHAGAIYIFNGADVKMTAGKITNNFSWNKGGAIWVSEEAYASVLWNQNPNYTGPHMKSVGYAGFTMDGGEISGNMTVNRGGAINVMSNHVKLINGVIKNNSSRVLGGAIYVEGDGTDRMYTMVVNKGCIAGNTAYTKANAQNGTLNRTFGAEPSNPCDFVNDITAGGSTTSNGNVTHSADFGGYNGYGGGIWMCSFGGNATFNASENFDVKVDGNTAQNRGQDLHVHVLKGGSTNGVNIMKLGNNNFYVEGTENKIQENHNYQGIVSIVNKDNLQTCPAGGMVIEGNQATVGGGIATNGTIIFGDDVNVYEATTNLKIKKTWEEAPEAGTKVNLKLYVKYNGQRVAVQQGGYDPLAGYEITLNGAEDTLVQGEPGEGEYNENSGVWESAAYEANMGLPMIAVLEDGTTVPLFKFNVNGQLLDPSVQADLKILYEYLKGGDKLTTAQVAGNWNIEVVETINGKEVEYELPLGDEVQVDSDNTKALEGSIRDYKDRTGKIITSFGTYPLSLSFKTEVHNTATEEDEPKVEKYINNIVHQSLENVDEEFTYSIMAYVPKDSKEAVITDTLGSTLEFVNKDVKTVMESVVVFKDNDHLGDGNGTVATGKVNGVNVQTRVAGKIRNNDFGGNTLEGQTLTVTLPEIFINDVLTNDTNGEGFWVRINFKAKYNTEVLKTIKESYIRNEDLKAVEADKLAYIKENGKVKWNESGKRYILLMDGVYYRSNVTTNGTEATSWEKHPNQAQWAKDFTSLDDADSKVIAGDASKIPLPYNGYVLNAQNPHRGTPNQADYDVTRNNGSASSHKTNIVTVDVEKPEVEKYVEKKVHADIVNFDEEFTYSVLAYVPEEATKVVLSDKLNSDLEFVETDPAKILTGVTIYKESTHKGDGSGAGKDKVFDAGRIQRNERKDEEGIGRIEVNGQTVSLTLEEKYLNEVRANNAFKDAKDKGFWVEMRFKARIKADSYDDIAAKIAKIEAGEANADATDSNISWEKVLNDKSTIDGEGTSHSEVTDGADVADDGSHAGLANKAEYKVTIGNQGESTYETNTVTVKPELTKIKVDKKWLVDGAEVEWPKGATVEVKVTKTENGQTKDVAGKTGALSETAPSIEFDGLPKLKNAGYGIEEVKVNDPQQTATGFHMGSAKKNSDGSFTIKNEKGERPEIEKNVNKKSDTGTAKDGGVHTDLAAFDEVFTYDIQAYITKDAKYVQITDQLVEVLRFVEQPTDTFKIVYKPGTGDDGMTAPKLSDAGTSIDEYSADFGTGTPGKLVVTLGAQEAEEVLPYAGQWVQITFDVRIKDEYRSIEAIKGMPGVWTSAPISDNNPIDDASVDKLETAVDPAQSEITNHGGITNDASYQINFGIENANTYEDTSNTVTVKPSVTKVEVGKVWKLNGKPVNQWPSGAEVVVELIAIKNNTSVDISSLLPESYETEKTLTSADRVIFDNLPCLEGIEYTVQEADSSILVGYELESIDHNIDTNIWTIINAKTEDEKPEIEKYVNKKSDEGTAKDGGVYTDLEAFDEVYTYDIQAYIAVDATCAEITDQLKPVLEFVGDVNSVKVVVKEGEEDGTAPKLSKAGTAPEDAYTVEKAAWSEGKLVLTLGDAEGTEILKSAGMWIQITFDAKIKDDYRSIKALKDAGVNVWETIVDNDPIDDATVDESHSGATVEAHEGIVNDSSYRMKKAGVDVGNTWTYNDDSNTVTVQPKTTEVSVSKEWLLDGKKVEWPNGATVEVKLIGKDGKVVATETLTAEKQSVTFSELPCLEGVTYEVEEGKVTNAGAYKIGAIQKVKEGEFKITNTGETEEPAPETTSINVVKVWDDWNNAEGKRPTSITVRLYANGKDAGVEPLVLSADDKVAENQWKGSFTNLPKHDADGKEITYTIVEDAVEYYVVEILDAADGFVVKNISRPWIPRLPSTPGKYGKLSVTKTVSGAAEKDKLFSFTVKITWASGDVTQSNFSIKANESYTTDYIPEDADVEIIENNANEYNVTYTVDEVIGSKLKVVGDKDHKAIVNNHKEQPKKPSPNTGDENNMMLWLGICVAAGITVFTSRKLRRK